MKLELSNLGALRWAEITLGDLTIICGGNNTGKTYAAYALYGFLHLWRNVITINIPNNKITELQNEGVINIDLTNYIKNSEKILLEGCKEYTNQLSRVFASSTDKFKDTVFNIKLEHNDDVLKEDLEYERRIGSANKEQISITKSANDNKIIVTLLTEKHALKLPHHIISEVIGEAIEEVIFNVYFPRPFIASAERTGAAIFRKELNFARNRLLKEMSQSEKNIDPIELLLKSYQDYALPVEKDVDFTRQLETIVKQKGYLQENHSELLKDFADIIGGKYTVYKDDQLYFIPNKGPKTRLTMDESSSAVRSLLGIGFYLKHIAKPGDMLIVDEPELNLHPENQRRIARLFAQLVNIGIKVFITTHSDYIIKELNTLIMLNDDDERLSLISKNEGYRKSEFINYKKVKVYTAEKASVQIPSNSRKTKVQTLTQAKIDSKTGIEASSFDKTIDTMNRIQDEIIWG